MKIHCIIDFYYLFIDVYRTRHKTAAWLLQKKKISKHASHLVNLVKLDFYFFALSLFLID